ncbi:MAG: ATP-binding cassette protein, partial [Anaerocolumna sp.]|nr:ATP-binding cassette protein [Anaerocolumna sp.]
ILTDMNRRGQSIVMVTHDMKAACRADRFIYIQDGKIDGIIDFEKYQEKDISDREAIIFSYISKERKTL